MARRGIVVASGFAFQKIPRTYGMDCGTTAPAPKERHILAPDGSPGCRSNRNYAPKGRRRRHPAPLRGCASSSFVVLEHRAQLLTEFGSIFVSVNGLACSTARSKTSCSVPAIVMLQGFRQGNGGSQ